MTKDEMRFLRRELINEILHMGLTSFEFISYFTRLHEVNKYKQELRIY